MPETETRMRLSCTITGAEGPSAIIKFQGKSYVLMVGDKLGDYRVASIGVNHVELRRGRELMTLQTQKAPDTIDEERRMFGPEGERRPVIEVKRVPIGNS